MLHALRRALAAGRPQAMIVGSDVPTLPAGHLSRLLRAKVDVALGPAVDGGYYAIACRKTHPRMFAGVEWSGARALHDTVRRFAEAELAPRAAEIDENAIFATVHLEKLAALGVMGMNLPERVGGAGVSALALFRAVEAIAGACASTASMVTAHYPATDSILLGGDEALQARVLPGAAAGDQLRAFAITDPGAGSNPPDMTTRARHDGGRGVKLLWQHDAREPIGAFETMGEDGRGLWVRGRLLLDVRRGAEAHALLKAGAIDGLSIGYTAIEAEIEPRSGLRRLTEIDLWEISLVTFQACPGAIVDAVKDRAPRPATTIRAFERFLRDAGGYSRNAAKALAAGGFHALAQRDVDDETAETVARLARAATILTNRKEG